MENHTAFYWHLHVGDLMIVPERDLWNMPIYTVHDEIQSRSFPTLEEARAFALNPPELWWKD